MGDRYGPSKQGDQYVFDADGVLTAPPNPVAPGDYVLLTARIDLVCAISACPFDMPSAGWEVNAHSGPTELIVEIA